jgi:hypothetical protein
MALHVKSFGPAHFYMGSCFGHECYRHATSDFPKRNKCRNQERHAEIQKISLAFDVSAF